MSSFRAKLGNMRKEKDWTVYPQGESDTLIIQCDDRIAAINPEKKKAVLSKSTRNPGFVYLNPALGATVIDVTEDLIALVKSKQPKPDDEIGPSVFVAPARNPLVRLAEVAPERPELRASNPGGA